MEREEEIHTKARRPFQLATTGNYLSRGRVRIFNGQLLLLLQQLPSSNSSHFCYGCCWMPMNDARTSGAFGQVPWTSSGLPSALGVAVFCCSPSGTFLWFYIEFLIPTIRWTLTVCYPTNAIFHAPNFLRPVGSIDWERSELLLIFLARASLAPFCAPCEWTLFFVILFFAAPIKTHSHHRIRR